MQQIATYLAGERDYVKLRGDTGPLVYPAAHVYIYRALYALTDEGRDVRIAQYIFTALYLATLGLVMLCYGRAGAPPYIFPLLVLSKRLHSIFLLRLFNDGFAVFFLFLAIYCYQCRMWTLGSLAYSVGLGVKMSLLLALPAVGVVLWQGMGRDRAVKQALLMGQVQVSRTTLVGGDTSLTLFQVLLGYPFIIANARSYVARAFEFSRQFLFKWTVNWRFVGEEIFLSRWFSVSLLVLHAALLLAFISSKWLHTSISNAFKDLIHPPSARYQSEVAKGVTPSFILTTILSSVIIGCLCARSLHYQFYAYIFWSTPFLLWRSGLHPTLIFGTWAAQEWAWNVYPSTDTSSMTVIECLMIQVLAVWLGKTNESIATSEDKVKEHLE